VIRVLLADDQALVRAGFRVLLETEDGFEVCGEAADGREAVEMTRSYRPDVVVMDVRMPIMDGLSATAAITGDAELGATRVLVLTTFDVDEYVYRALRAGASGFLLKDAEPAELLRGIRLAVSGDALLAPSITRRLIDEFVTRPAQPSGVTVGLQSLTAREREVLTLVGGGSNNDEIAARLVISPATARTHVGHILSKLGARDRVQLVVIAYESGLLTPRSVG
jgi:DNA-binding NarL/FixJ family response regulator